MPAVPRVPDRYRVRSSIRPGGADPDGPKGMQPLIDLIPGDKTAPAICIHPAPFTSDLFAQAPDLERC